MAYSMFFSSDETSCNMLGQQKATEYQLIQRMAEKKRRAFLDNYIRLCSKKVTESEDDDIEMVCAHESANYDDDVNDEVNGTAISEFMKKTIVLPDRTLWNVQGASDISDKPNVVEVRIGTFAYKTGRYNIIACADVKTPSNSYYRVDNDPDFPAPKQRDYRLVVIQILRTNTITTQQLKDADRDLFIEVTNKRQQDMAKQYEQLRKESIHMKIKAGSKGIKDMLKRYKEDKEMAKAYDLKYRQQHQLWLDDQIGGIMGVYRRSSMHGDYSGMASEVSRKVG